MTRPNISIPAFARAVLAATVPVATQESIPSFSMIVRKTSMVDLGKSSRRTLGMRDWWMRTAIERSSASWVKRVHDMLLCERVETYSYWCTTLVTGKRGKLHLYVQATTFTVTCIFRLAGAVPALRRLVCRPNAERRLHRARTLHTQFSSVQFQYKPSHLLG